MNTTIPLSLLLMGLTGGLHCAAMCGGLVVASERASGERVLLPARRLFLNQLQLQGARVLSYTMLGGIAGLIGAGVWAASARPVQLALFALGNLLLLGVGLWMVLQQVASPRWLAWWQRGAGAGWIGQGLTRLTQPLLSRLLPFDTFAKRLGAGLLWGLLPCGLVYSALSLAFLSATAWEGALAMLAFGLGTLPHMLFAGHTLRWISQRTNRRGFHLVAGAVLLLFAADGFWKLLNAGSALPMGGCA
ncbi:MAG: sulfite exporter TauE/SafE family protein [Thiomonas sp.]